MIRKILVVIGAIGIIVGSSLLVTKYFPAPAANEEFAKDAESFETENKRVEQLDKFTQAAQLPTGVSGNTENSGGYTGTTIRNKEILLNKNFIHLDGMIALEEQFQLPVKSLIAIGKETHGMDDAKLSAYFTKNADMLNQLYKISDFNGFLNFQKQVADLYEANSIEILEIQPDSIQKPADVLSFSLTVVSNNNVQLHFNIKVAENNKKNADMYNVYWE